MKRTFWVLLFLSVSETLTAEDSLTNNEISMHDHEKVGDLLNEQTKETDASATDTCCSQDLIRDLEMRLKILEKENRDQAEKIRQLEIRSFNTNMELLQQKTLITEIRTECNDKPKYAFAAALWDGGHIGPSDRESTLIFRKVLTNIGNTYNPASGIFVAPVKGVYYFSVSSFTLDEMNSACVSLFRNHERLLTACDHSSADRSDSASNGAAIELEKNDHVYITLHAYSRVYDDLHNRNCFSGFLLFTL
nr:complement C1q-like protein 2 [Misgurnus anguillicaudatus]